MTDSDIKQISRQRKDCKGCRILGGLGLIGASWYVFTGIRNQHPQARPLVILFAAGLGYCGVARFAQWPPFDDQGKIDSNMH